MCMQGINTYDDEICVDDDYALRDDDFIVQDDDFLLYDEFAGMTPDEIEGYYYECDVLEYIKSFYLHNVPGKYKYPLHMFYEDILNRIKCTA